METNKKRKLKKKYKNIILNFIIIVLVLIFLVSTYKTIKILYYDNKNKKDNDKLIKEVVKPIENNDKDNNANEDKEDEPLYDIDFNALKKINKDVVGWIMIPNTSINYPIVKGNDNSYYLTRNLEKEYNRNGTIFMNYKNSRDFTDSNTTLFGHNSYNATMFGELKKIYNMELGNKVDIYIYTDFGFYRYSVYSAYIAEPYDAEPLATGTKFFEKTDKKYDYVNTNLETLTLSTCHTDRTKRLIIHAIRQATF